VTAALLEETGLITMANPIDVNCKSVTNSSFLKDEFVPI
jgi:hypothetical protein